MAVSISTTVSLRLEPPDMVPQIDSRDELCLGELGEIAVDCGSIEAAMIERRRHLGVGLWPRCRKHVLHNRQSGCSASQPGSADEALEGVD